MSDILKEYIKNILKEVIVTVSNGSDSRAYDVEFDKAGNIKRGTKVDLDEEQARLLEIAKPLTLAPVGIILGKIQEERIQLQQDAPPPKQMVKILNKSWKDTLSWPAPDRIGRGELALSLAFKRSNDKKEPDFVSANESAKLSVKFFGDGTKKALTGDADQRVPKAVLNLGNLLKTGFQGGTWSATQMRQTLENMNPRARRASIPRIETALQELKNVIIHEHDAMGIMGADTTNGFYFIDKPGDIQLYAIRFGGTRIEFWGPYGTGTTLESVLNEFK